MYPQIFGKYVLKRELAKGGMARVFEATLRGASGFEKRLAVKQIRPELASDPRFVERFVEEAKTAVGLTHPNIVPVYELGVEGGVYYIAMELCPGLTLADILAFSGGLGVEEGCYVGVELSRALDYAHRRGGIVHRDVTPRNVLIDDEGAVRLIDFGIAHPVTATLAREVFGSPGHMPPEQIRGEELGPPADVFALGALVIEACTGVPPFRRATEGESLLAAETLPERPSVHEPRLEPLDAVLLAAVDPDPARRLANIDELGRALRETLRGTDLGDLARALGRRVQRVRRTSHSALRPPTTPVTLPVARLPSRTFATRPLIEEPFDASEVESSEAITRPLAPVDPETPPLLPPENEAQRFRPWLLLSVLLGASFLIVGWLRAGAGSLDAPAALRETPDVVRAPPPIENVTDPTRVRELAPSPEKPAELEPAPRVPPVLAPLPSSSESRPQNVARRPPLEPSERGAASAPAASGAGTVVFTAAPTAEVTIAGQRLVTPVQALKLPPGEYQATFTSPAWDGALSARVQVEPGSARHLHADFTSEPPRLVVR